MHRARPAAVAGTPPSHATCLHTAGASRTLVLLRHSVWGPGKPPCPLASTAPGALPLVCVARPPEPWQRCSWCSSARACGDRCAKATLLVQQPKAACSPAASLSAAARWRAPRGLATGIGSAAVLHCAARCSSASRSGPSGPWCWRRRRRSAWGRTAWARRCWWSVSSRRARRSAAACCGAWAWTSTARGRSSRSSWAAASAAASAPWTSPSPWPQSRPSRTPWSAPGPWGAQRWTPPTCSWQCCSRRTAMARCSWAASARAARRKC
mmetsp:Transcript_99257/g.320111  ORF Transcript_99257/g.320111 Transcript_99257/m.320111 type:complete len:267 (+) Transcript_99257:182-982(+)